MPLQNVKEIGPELTDKSAKIMRSWLNVTASVVFIGQRVGIPLVVTGLGVGIPLVVTILGVGIPLAVIGLAVGIPLPSKHNTFVLHLYNVVQWYTNVLGLLDI